MIKLALSHIASTNWYNFLEGNPAIHFESLKNAYRFTPVILHLRFLPPVIIRAAHKDLCIRLLL